MGNMRRITYVLTVSIILSLALSITGCGSTTPSSVQTINANTTTPPTTTPPVDQSKSIYKVGDTQKIGQFQLTVNSIKTTDGGQYIKPSEGDQFVFVDVTIENQGDKDSLISSMAMFDLINKDGRKSKFTIPEKMDTIDGTLGVGRKITGELGYEISNSDKDFDLVFTTSQVDGSQGVVKISL